MNFQHNGILFASHTRVRVEVDCLNWMLHLLNFYISFYLRNRCISLKILQKILIACELFDDHSCEKFVGVNAQMCLLLCK